MGARHPPPDCKAGYFGVGGLRPRRAVNMGGLWRSAHALGAAFLFSIRDRLPEQARRNLVAADPALGQPTDTGAAWRYVPYLTFPSVDELRESAPLCQIVGIERSDDAVDLREFEHPEHAVYLLGSEIDGLTGPTLERCDHLVRLPTEHSLNVAVSGALVMYDRLIRGGG